MILIILRNKYQHFNDPLGKHYETDLENKKHVFIGFKKKNKVILKKIDRFISS